MSTAGPPQGARPPGGAARSAVRGEPTSTAGPPQGARPPGGAARSAVRGKPASTAGIQPEIAVAAVPGDERVWVPQAQDVWFRPLLLNTVSGGWCNLLRVRRSGILSRHRHPMLVVGYVIKGRWKYLEHDWTAEEGSFVYEPPGEIHTLTVPEDCAEMITFFNISGAMIYLDDEGRQNGYEDVWSKIDMCRAHYATVGLGAHYVEQFIR
jgi:2,4'-dihydroxyacetophenone dioxygenase